MSLQDDIFDVEDKLADTPEAEAFDRIHEALAQAERERDMAVYKLGALTQAANTITTFFKGASAALTEEEDT